MPKHLRPAIVFAVALTVVSGALVADETKQAEADH